MTVTKKHKDKTALDAFIEHKNNIEKIINRLQGACDDHFAINPEDINWGDVGLIADAVKDLELISDKVFKEGEYK
jgi:hypothetical protein